MIQVLKLTLLSVLLLATVNTTNAAFPKAKEISKKAIVSNIPVSNKLTESVVTKATLKKEFKQLNNQTSKRYAYGGKSKSVAIVLALLVGGLGIHSFYMGQKTKGFIQLGIYLTGLGLYVAGAIAASGYVDTIPITLLVGMLLIFGVAIWAFIDFIRILTGGLEPEEGFDS